MQPIVLIHMLKQVHKNVHPAYILDHRVDAIRYLKLRVFIDIRSKRVDLDVKTAIAYSSTGYSHGFITGVRVKVAKYVRGVRSVLCRDDCTLPNSCICWSSI